MKKIFTSVFIFFLSLKGFTQVCDYFPADCPDEGSIEAAQSSSIRLGNGLLLQEIKMQDTMRGLITAMMFRAAKTLHWQPLELDEIANLGAFQSGGTAYALRSPRFYGISFEFIVNNDSLKAWKDWRIDFSDRAKDSTLSDMNKQTDISNSPLYKQYTDSMNQYLKLMTDYMTAHQNEGLKLLEDKQLVYFQNKQTEFSNKQSALLNTQQSQNNSTKIDNERATYTSRFRNASTVEIFFQFNPGVGIVHSSDGEEQVNNYNLPGTTFAKSVHILNPDTYSTPWFFDQWQNMTVLLFGKWISKIDKNNNYDAVYTLNGQSDEHTPKKIMSDLIQTIAIHVMGNKVNMDKLIQQLDISKLNGVINK